MKIKQLFFLVLFVSSQLIFSQSFENSTALDNDFLESLSDEMGDDLITENKEADEIDQLLRSEVSLEKTKILLSKIRDQLETIEAEISKDKDENYLDLEIFGKDFFQTLQSTFSPINIPNPDGTYVVDVGDKFSITVVGSADAELEVTIERDGYLQIPKYGRLQVAGLTLTEVEKKVQDFFTTRAIGSESYIQLTSMRDVQVIVIGGVEYPGIYTISGGSNILSAINVAGGIKENGSFRNIELSRNGSLLRKIDLYELFVGGSQNFATVQLRSGDIVNVKPVSFHVPVSGAANNNAIYEILEGESIEDVINFAGGFSQNFYGYDFVNLYRAGINGYNTLKIEKDRLSSIILLPRDSLIIPSFDNDIKKVKYVQVLGRVNNPGIYAINEGDKLSEVIIRAGGYKDDAYIYGGALFRQNAIDKEKFYSQLNYQDTVNFVISAVGRPNTVIDQKIIPLLQEELKSKSYEGRVVAEFDLSKLDLNPSMDVALQDNDKIIIPALEKVVYLFGDFKNPSNVFYDPDKSILDYIELAGGLRDSAYESVIIINPDGTTKIFEKRNNFLSFGKAPDIYPGSIIYAQRNIGRLDGIQFTATLAPIISSLAISLASLNSISND